MPYTVKKSSKCPKDKPYAVVKKSDPNGKVFGCHPSRASAVKQIAAIESNESKHNHEAVTRFIKTLKTDAISPRPPG